MLTVAEVKQHLRVDYDADDTMLAGLIRSADNYMRSAIDDFDAKFAASENSEGDDWAEAAKLAEKILIADWYENRTPVEAGKVTSVQMIIYQLQHTSPKGYAG